jgi:hypothetical protein
MQSNRGKGGGLARKLEHTFLLWGADLEVIYHG